MKADQRCIIRVVHPRGPVLLLISCAHPGLNLGFSSSLNSPSAWFSALKNRIWMRMLRTLHSILRAGESVRTGRHTYQQDSDVFQATAKCCHQFFMTYVHHERNLLPGNKLNLRRYSTSASRTRNLVGAPFPNHLWWGEGAPKEKGLQAVFKCHKVRYQWILHGISSVYVDVEMRTDRQYSGPQCRRSSARRSMTWTSASFASPTMHCSTRSIGRMSTMFQNSTSYFRLLLSQRHGLDTSCAWTSAEQTAKCYCSASNQQQNHFFGDVPDLNIDKALKNRKE